MPVYECICGVKNGWIIYDNKIIECCECERKYKLVHGLQDPSSFNAQRKHYEIKKEKQVTT